LNQRTDKELVAKLKKNDVKSFDALYMKYHQSIYFNIKKLTKDPEVTHDILQEVFISLWEKRATMDENKPVLNWLISVSYNKSINYLKSQLRDELKIKAFCNVNLIDDKERNLRELQLDQLENAVKNLSPQKGRVFNLCKLQGKTYDQTAKELNISKYTVKEYLVEAVVNVKDYIKSHPGSFTALFCAGFILAIL